MKQKTKNAHAFLLGALTALLLVGLAVPAFAAPVAKSIEVRSGVRVFIDDQELIPKDANGNQVEVFIYNGTTYLPARAISEAFGKPIQWDGKVQGIYIGKHNSSTPVTYLSKLDYFTEESDWIIDNITKDNLGNEHTHSIYPEKWVPASRTYKLNAQYSRLTGVYYQRYEARSSTIRGQLVISGDEQELWRGSVEGGIEPINIDIDLTGVLELKLEFECPGLGTERNNTVFGDVALWA